MADFTYARTWGGFVYVFVIDVYAQKIVGWHAAPTKAQRARPDVRPDGDVAARTRRPPPRPRRAHSPSRRRLATAASPGRFTDLDFELGVVENLNVSERHGGRFHFFHTLTIVTWDSPSSARSSRDDQCVPSRAGGASSVATTICASSITCGRPGLGRSSRLPSPSRYRDFQP